MPACAKRCPEILDEVKRSADPGAHRDRGGCILCTHAYAGIPRRSKIQRVLTPPTPKYCFEVAGINWPTVDV